MNDSRPHAFSGNRMTACRNSRLLAELVSVGSAALTHPSASTTRGLTGAPSDCDRPRAARGPVDRAGRPGLPHRPRPARTRARSPESPPAPLPASRPANSDRARSSPRAPNGRAVRIGPSLCGTARPEYRSSLSCERAYPDTGIAEICRPARRHGCRDPVDPWCELVLYSFRWRYRVKQRWPTGQRSGGGVREKRRGSVGLRRSAS